jgi:tetratricopeptide (TPR) repeat protein
MKILSNRAMPAAMFAFATLLAIGPVSNGFASELDDIVARIDYGFYTGDPRMIQAARDELGRTGSDGGAHAYYEAYAAYRLSRLDRSARPRQRRALIRACLEAGRASTQTAEWAAEAWILVAACSIQGIAQEPSRALGHEARLNEALAAARELDADNPRLLLVESWYRQNDMAIEVARERRRELLERAREEFDVRANDQGPDWGRAELLASLAKIHLELGERRNARDLIEQALIEAPDYYLALELRKALLL